jgi:predicted ATP-grasp superfamily ATP-dependent carboligase
MSMRGAVLVTDGEERAALAAVRSLGRAGYRVYVCAAREHALASTSRHCHAAARTPSPLSEPALYRETVAKLLDRWKITVLLPVSEVALRVLLPARFEDRGVYVPFPSPDTFGRVSDKGELLRRCSRFDIAVPDQRVLQMPSQLDEIEAALTFPLVVKPTRSVVLGPNGAIKTGVMYASNVGELRRCLASFPDAVYPVLLQQRIVGPGSGVFLLVWDGELIATFAHRRLREKPPAGGVSVYSESTPADPALVERGLRLLRDFGWQGVAMLEFKTDRSTRRPYLMEVNGRLWGSLQLAVDAGVDFPALLVGCALGDKPVSSGYRVGLRNRWWWGDVDHLLARLRRSARELGLPPDAPSRWRVLRDFLRLWRPGDRSEILRLTDPMPFVRETLDWLRPCSTVRKGSSA